MGGGARAVAVMIRDDEHTTIVAEGERIALMVVDPAVSWSELPAIIHGLVLEGRETESGCGPTDLSPGPTAWPTRLAAQ